MPQSNSNNNFALWTNGAPPPDPRGRGQSTSRPASVRVPSAPAAAGNRNASPAARAMAQEQQQWGNDGNGAYSGGKAAGGDYFYMDGMPRSQKRPRKKVRGIGFLDSLVYATGMDKKHKRKQEQSYGGYR